MPHIPPPGPSASDSEEVVILLDMRFKPGSAEEVMKRMRPAIEATRDEAGNNEYTFYQVSGRPDEYVFLERWLDQEAFDSHLTQPHMESVFALFEEHLAFPMSEIIEHRTFLEDLHRK